MVVSKSKIGPKNRITISHMELNRSLMGKWIKEFVESVLSQEFGWIIHLVDSLMVLGYLHKADVKLKPYEGVRVAEIQASGSFEEGRLLN